MLVLAGMGMAFGVQAQDATSGFYVGAGIGQNKLEESNADLGFSFDGDDTAFTLFGGYQFNPWLAAEVGFIDGGSPSDTVQGVNIEVDSTAIEVALVGKVQVNRALTLFARAGLLAWDIEATARAGGFSARVEDDGNDLSYGLGGVLAAGPALDIRLQWRSAELQDTDLSLIDVSAIWKF
ncbi:MAG TPA: porin family protein [Steroidobacter sp.]